MQYFWYHRPEDHFPPPAVSTPDAAGPSDRLNVVCTRTDLPRARQRALVRDWCDLLPTLTHVRLLWFSCRVPQDVFDAACSMPGLEGLYAKSSGVRRLDALRAAPTLRYLHLGNSPAVESIEPVGDCGGLEWLGLENLKRINALDPLARLTGLVGLYVEGSMWSTQRVAMLAPIGTLTDLRYLHRQPAGGRRHTAPALRAAQPGDVPRRPLVGPGGNRGTATPQPAPNWGRGLRRANAVWRLPPRASRLRSHWRSSRAVPYYRGLS